MSRLLQFLRAHLWFFVYAAIVIWISSSFAGSPPSPHVERDPTGMRGGGGSWGTGWGGGK